MIKSALIDPTDGTAVKTEKFWKGPHKLDVDARSLLVTEAYKSHGVFKTATFVIAQTIELVTPSTGGSIIVTDLVVNGDKVNGGRLVVKFTDDTEDDTIIGISTTDAPVASAIAFSGRFQGWKDARIDVVVTGNIAGSVVVGYIKVPNGLPYNEWDELR